VHHTTTQQYLPDAANIIKVAAPAVADQLLQVPVARATTSREMPCPALAPPAGCSTEAAAYPTTCCTSCSGPSPACLPRTTLAAYSALSNGNQSPLAAAAAPEQAAGPAASSLSGPPAMGIAAAAAAGAAAATLVVPHTSAPAASPATIPCSPNPPAPPGAPLRPVLLWRPGRKLSKPASANAIGSAVSAVVTGICALHK
jgi:hypothetical protein